MTVSGRPRLQVQVVRWGPGGRWTGALSGDPHKVPVFCPGKRLPAFAFRTCYVHPQSTLRSPPVIRAHREVSVEVGLIVAIGFRLGLRPDQRLPRCVQRDRHLCRDTGATPGQAVVLSAVFNMAGPFLGTAVADTIGGIVTVPTVADGLRRRGRTGWGDGMERLHLRRGLPSSSGHSLVGGLTGAAIADGLLGPRRPQVGELGRAQRLASHRGDGCARRADDPPPWASPSRCCCCVCCDWPAAVGRHAGTCRSASAGGPLCRGSVVPATAAMMRRRRWGVVAVLLLASVEPPR